MIKGWKKLTREQRHHLRHDAGCFTLEAFQQTIDDHAKWDREHPEFRPTCWECKKIAEALGISPRVGE